MSNNGLHWLRVGAIVIAASIAPTIALGIALPGAASAQLFFDWGGQEKVNDSGRQSVRLNVDAKPGEIIVSFTDRKLYLMTGPGQALSYPVAIPREQDRWEGKTTVTQKRENPSWTPTPTMIKENPRLPRWVPGGHPMNPLGNRALYLGSSFYRIHGTDAPWTIGTAVSKGCIRMYNKDALDVYERSKVGAKVLVTWNAYQSTPDGDQAQTAAREEAPAATPAAVAVPAAATGARGGAPIPVRGMDRGPQQSQQQQQQAQAPNSSAGRQSRPDTRYSDVFGTPGPQGSASEPAADADVAPRPQAQPSRQSRESRAREGQPQREPRRTRETTTERSETVGTAPDNAQPVATPTAAPRSSEPRARSTSVETGALPERRPRAKAAAPATEQAQPGEAAKAVPAQAQAAPQPDVATRALEAAERAAAAAERAAAAAERAERAVSARPVAPAAAPAPSPANGSD